MTIKSQLGRMVGKSWWDEYQIRQAAGRLLEQRRIAVIWLDDIKEEIGRTYIEQVARQQAEEVKR